jgi:hypothetical protein
MAPCGGWTTIDAGEERNERRRVYAVTGRLGRLGPPQLVHRAPHLNSSAMTGQPGTDLELAVAPNGRALLIWGLDRPEEHSDEHSVRVAEAAPDAPFGASRQLVADGEPGDVAVLSDGRALAVWSTPDGLRASLHRPGQRFRTREVVTDRPFGHPRASFNRGHPRVEWGNAFTEREAP